MTSLARQLAQLKTASSVAQGVERDYSSLIFDKKEAEQLSRDQAYKLGLAGLSQLKKLDPTIDEIEPDLFDEANVNLNRFVLTKDEDSKLSASLERLIAAIAPYFNHQSCKQVLEWLIYRYSVHTCNAEFLATALLPFHDTNAYGRLGSILLLKNNEWQWLKQITADGSPIAFSDIVKHTLKEGGNLHVVVAMFSLLNKVQKFFDEEYITKNFQYYYLFVSKVVVHVFRDSINATDSMITRVTPLIGSALKSRVLPFKLAGCVMILQLSSVASFSAVLLDPIITLLLSKLQKAHFTVTMHTLISLCQRQEVECLPLKPVRVLVRRSGELEVADFLSKTGAQGIDLAAFLKPLWNALFKLLRDNVSDEERAGINAILEATTNSATLTGEAASVLFNQITKGDITAMCDLSLSKTTRNNIRQVAIRFAEEFDALRQSNEEGKINVLMTLCNLQPSEIVPQPSTVNPRKRPREEEEPILVDPEILPPFRETTIKDILGDSVKTKITGTPSEILAKIKDEEFGDAGIMLQAFQKHKYVNAQSEAEMERFLIEGIRLLIGSKTLPVLTELKAALSNTPVTESCVERLLERKKAEPKTKKAKVDKPAADEFIFGDESDEEYQKRMVCVLEILNANDTYRVGENIFRTFFVLLESFVDKPSDESTEYLISLLVTLFLKSIQKPGAARVVARILRLDAFVMVIRFTSNHVILRNTLKILTILAPLVPNDIVTQIMSVFTFMGGENLLKRDNDLTLTIVEEALNALFSSIMKTSASDKSTSKGADSVQVKIRSRLIDISRVFTASLMDIPAHRRGRVLKAITHTIAERDVWILVAVIYDNYCQKWQKSTATTKDVELIHDIALDFVSEFEPEVQVLAAITLIEYILHLGSDNQSAIDRIDSACDCSDFSAIVIFDRNTRSLQKLRHFRFLLFTFISKLLNHKPLYEMLSFMDDNQIYTRMVDVGKRMLSTIGNLEEFINSSTLAAEKAREVAAPQEASQAVRYWIALAAKADVVRDRMRCLLPSDVSGRIICDLLAEVGDREDESSTKIRDRALQLLNSKLMTQTGESEMEAEYLVKFTEKLNSWLAPAESQHGITLCQCAAFSLKLVAKRLPSTVADKVFVGTIEKSLVVLRQWKSLDEVMVANVVLLISELVRSQNLKTTLLHIEEICIIVAEILQGCDDQANSVIEQIYAAQQAEEEAKKASPASTTAALRKRQRVAQISLCGRAGVSEDALLLCSLTCTQRLFDFASAFISSYYGPFLLVVCKLSVKYLSSDEATDEGHQLQSPRMDSIRDRIRFIRATLARQEIRLLVDPLKTVVATVAKRPLTLASVVDIFGENLKLSKQDAIGKVLNDVVELFVTLFKFRRSEKKAEKFGLYNTCENSIITAFLALVEHLRADALQSIIRSFVETLQTVLADSSSSPGARVMALTVFNFANHFYDSFHDLAVPFFAQLFDVAIKMLARLNASTTDDFATLYFDGTEKESLDALRAHALITYLVQFVDKCARHQVLFSPELAKASYAVVLNELENVEIYGHKERCVPSLASCIYSISAASPDLFNTELCNALLQRTRHRSSAVRYRTLLVFAELVNRFGEDIAPQMPSIVQHLSESLEDNNRKVAAESEKIVRTLRDKFGDSVFGNADE